MWRWLTLSFWVPVSLQAQPVAFASGEYLAQNGWGQLVLSNPDGLASDFSLDTLGANGHMCFVEGRLENGMASVSLDEDEAPCQIQFSALPGGIQVSLVDEEQTSCRHFCGMRASFTGEYYLPRAGCTLAGVKQGRADFKRAYDQKDYWRAYQQLAPILRDCEPWLLWSEEGWMQNDLAITLYHLQEYSACLQVLEPFNQDLLRDDNEVAENYAPSDWDTYQRILKAARVNVGLCSSSIGKSKK